MIPVKITQEDFKNANSYVSDLFCPLACALRRLKISFIYVSGTYVKMENTSYLRIKGGEDLKYAFICQETSIPYKGEDIDNLIQKAKAGEEVPTIQLYLYD